MDIRSLPQDVRAKLRSGINVNNLTQCVNELVYNSLDAKSTAIAVRVNVPIFRIQVVDNGRGISKLDMGLLGIRYMTSKCHTLQDLYKKTKSYGFRGESLASIATCSEKATITSRFEGTDCTYMRVIQSKFSSEVVEVKQRLEHGTTVTVEGFLYNMPVRQNCIKPEREIEDVKNNLELLALINPNVSFSLRNDANSKILLKVNKTASVLELFLNLHTDLDADSLSSCEISKGNISISGLIYSRSYPNKHLQLTYINRRPVNCHKINKQVKSLYKAACKSNEHFINDNHPVYVLNIRCPYSEVDLVYNPSKITAEFKNWDFLSKCIEKLFLKKWNLKVEAKTICTRKNGGEVCNKEVSISDVFGVVKGLPVKRKSSDDLVEDQSASPVDKKSKMETRKFALTDSHFAENKQIKANYENLSFVNQEPYRENYQSYELFDQNQGKHLIMNKFLKSAAEYRDISYDEVNVFEEAPSICIEQTEKSMIATKRDFNTTMTYSMKVTTKRTIKRKPEAKNKDFTNAVTLSNYPKKQRAAPLNLKATGNKGGAPTLNKCVQTSFVSDPICGVKKGMVSKSVQTGECLHTAEYADSEFNAFHYYLPEEEEAFVNCSPVGNKSTISHYFYNRKKRDTQKGCHNHLGQDESDRSVHFLNKAAALPFNPDNITFCIEQNVFHASDNTNYRNYNVKPNTELFKEPLIKHKQEERCHKPIDNTLFTLGNITLSPIKRKTTYQEQYTKHNTFFPWAKKALRRHKSAAAANVDCFIEKPFSRSKSSDEQYRLQETSPDFFKSGTRSSEICKKSFRDLFKTKSKPGLLGGSPIFVDSKSIFEIRANVSDDKPGISEIRSPGIEEDIIIEETVAEESNANNGSKELSFSFSDADRKALLINDLGAEERFNKELFKTVTEISEMPFVEAPNFEQFGDGIKHKSIFGQTTYFNKRTGITTYNLPEREVFTFKERLNLLPKGSSPIMSAFSRVDKLMSPESKQYLEKTILQSFENDVLTIKWQKYLKNKDYRSFFDELYRQKAREFEGNMQTIPTVSKASFETMITFSQDILNDVSVVGQIDKKFIAVVTGEEKRLVFFDQHAVHERIRVEKLLKEYKEEGSCGLHKYKSVHYRRKIQIFLSESDIEFIQTYKTAFNSAGLDFTCSDKCVEVCKVPECFFNKANKNDNTSSHKLIKCLTKTLMLEIIDTLKSTKGCLTTAPSIITNVINSEACRGAIKFGDVLSHEDMKQCLKDLARCKLAFQCAHGRPTLAPILLLQETSCNFKKPNFRKMCLK